jgi:hypothetical protein
MSTQSTNEKKYKQWKETEQNGRIYWRRVEGQRGWYAIYYKETDGAEKTLRFWQEIYNDKEQLEEIHQKYPIDKGHQKIKQL